MSDKLTWFKFTPADWMMGRIRKMPKEIQADFMALICIYWNNECTLSLEDGELEIGENAINQLLKYKIIKKDGQKIAIDFLSKQMHGIESTSEKRRKAALQRWNAKPKEKDANAMQVNASALQNDADKIRVDQIIKEEKRESNRFTAPTIAEIQQYAKEKKYVSFNAARFHAYYESNGWKVGKNKMKDWKAAARGWQSRESENTQVQTSSKYDFL